MSENVPTDLVKPKDPTSLSPVGIPIEFPSVHLGAEGFKFRDRVNFPTNDGFVIELSQNSGGGTFIRAKSKDSEKFAIESLTQDESGEAIWEKPIEPNSEVMVRGDWTRSGNLRVRHGLVRITNLEDNTQRTFAVGADFKGTKDNWQAKGAYFEVVLPEKSKQIKEVSQLTN